MLPVVRSCDHELGYFGRDELAIGHDRIGGDYEPRNDIALPATVEGAMTFGVERQAENTRSDRIHPRNTTDKYIVNSLCLHKRGVRLYSHDFPRLGLVVALAQEEANHRPKADTSYKSLRQSGLSQFMSDSGKQVTTSFNTLGFSNLNAASSRRSNQPHGVSPSAPCGSQLHGAL